MPLPAAPPPPPALALHAIPAPATWTAAEIEAAHWPTPGGDPVWLVAPVADDYSLTPAGAAAALAARAAKAAAHAGGGAATPSAATTTAPPLVHGYPHYAPEDRYVPRVQADGGVLSDWQPMYAPTKEQAEADREGAFAAGVPFGSPAPLMGGAAKGNNANSNANSNNNKRPPLHLRVVSELHTDQEFSEVLLEISPDARVEAVRLAVRDATGVPPALLRLSYAGTRLEDAQRTLGHYGLAYWHGKFPHWPLVITRS